MNTLKARKLYTLKGFILWYVNYIRIRKKKEEEGKREQRLVGREKLLPWTPLAWGVPSQ